MAMFEIGQNSIVPLSVTSFGDLGMKERADLQRLLRDHVDVVSPNCLVISEEFGEWTESRRRVDLLAIDKDANLVVIELKRTEDGGHMELQALRYAAMVSTLTAQRAVEIFGEYLKLRERDDDPERTMLEFLEWEELDEDKFGQDVRLVLVSADFSRELTTAVLWLNEKDLDIRCVRIRPYSYQERTLVDVQQIIPLPEAARYQVQVREKKRRERSDRVSKIDFTRYDVTIDGHTYKNQWKRNMILLVVKHIFRSGVSPQDISVVLNLVRKEGHLWRSVDGEFDNVEEFNLAAAATGEKEGSTYVPRRWHAKDDDLFVYDGKTYVFSNQWGRSFPKAMELLKQNYPELKIEWTPTDGADS